MKTRLLVNLLLLLSVFDAAAATQNSLILAAAENTVATNAQATASSKKTKQNLPAPTKAKDSQEKTHTNKLAETEPQPVINQKVQKEQQVQTNPFGIGLYEPTYLLPFYYTFTPYRSIYENNTPDQQYLDNTEVNFQLSFKTAILNEFFHKTTSLNVAYTQVSFWQAYNSSAFFRETDYEPAVFLETHLPNLNFRGWHLSLLDLGFMHQSNGRGGDLERSWNRVYGAVSIDYGGFVVRLRPWYVLQDSQLKDYNPNIAHYLGYGDELIIYKYHKAETSLLLRNTAESGFSRGAEQLTFSYPVGKRFRVYVLGFSGYGQSLIEYDHYTNAVGIGFSVNDYV